MPEKASSSEYSPRSREDGEVNTTISDVSSTSQESATPGASSDTSVPQPGRSDAAVITISAALRTIVVVSSTTAISIRSVPSKVAASRSGARRISYRRGREVVGSR